MTPDDLFLDTMADLRRRTDLRASEYDVVQAAGLVRRLLVDATPLWSVVNRAHRLKPLCTISRMRTAVPATNGNVWLGGLWLDNPLTEQLLAALGNPLRSNLGPWEVPLRTFLKHKAIIRSSEHVDVITLVKQYANREGGVHYDPTPPDSALLRDVLDLSEPAVRLTVLAAARIVYGALEPVASTIVLQRYEWPLGLAGKP